MFDGDTFEVRGVTFRVQFPRDESMGEPWKEHDGHGIVSDWTTREKRPGERVLYKDHRSAMYYDFAATVQTARAEEWDAPPYGGTKGQRAARAAEADYKRMRAFCHGDWGWIGVVVEMLDDDGKVIADDSLWGIESDSVDYLDEVARELADGMLTAAYVEANERDEWAARGVETRVG